MSAYDFSRLNDRDFEELANDLYEEEYSVRVERFKRGPDQGIDGRFYVPKTKELVIIQAKHYLRSTLAALLSVLRKERLKIEKIKPKRYVLYTSLGLSPRDKEKISNSLKPIGLSSSDIYGIDEIEALLTGSEKLLKKHYKLWMSSATVLRDIVHSGVVNRSSLLAEEIIESEQLFVSTHPARLAESKILSRGSVILTGEPGAGKTTIAKHLCAWSAVDEFEIVDIACPDDAHKLWNKTKKQIFYFDDFLGSNYLALLAKDSSTGIFRLIDAVARDDSKRFVLTTRSVILNSAKQSTDVFRNHQSDLYELEVSADKINILEKARILYSHIFARLTKESHIGAFYRKKKYIQVVRHRNYNPRLIQFITSPTRLGEGDSSQLSKQISNFLDNPSDIWDVALNVQSHPCVSLLAKLVCYAGQSLEEEDLERAYYRINQFRLELTSSQQQDLDFRTSSRLASGSLLTRKVDEDQQVFYDTINPSIKDFVHHHHGRDARFLIHVSLALQSDDAIDLLKEQCDDGTVAIKVFHRVLLGLVDNMRDRLEDNFRNRSPYVVAVFEYALMDGLSLSPELVRAVFHLALTERPVRNVSKSCQIITLCATALTLDWGSAREELLCFLVEALPSNRGYWDLKYLTELARETGCVGEVQFQTAFQKEMVDYADFLLDDAKTDVVSDLRDEDKIDEIRSSVYSYVKDGISRFGIPVDYDFLDDVVDSLDYYEEMENNLNYSSYGGNDNDEDHRLEIAVSDAEIDDIFHR